MPPTFKKAKDYNPALASVTLGQQHDTAGAADKAVTADTCDERQQLLISLGLADEEEARPYKSAVEAFPKSQPDMSGGGHIGAFYPTRTDSGEGSNGGTYAQAPSQGVFDALRARLEATTTQLMQGRIGTAACEEVQELLLEQQHQIDLLLRGQSSLRGSMNNLRRTAAEKDAQARQLQQHLKEQHGAALKDMESKLERAIHQVQQLQQSTRDRQQQQTASLQQSLQSASDEAGQLRAKAEELQAALSQKEQELVEAQELQQNLRAELLQEQKAIESQRARFTQQLQDLTADCQAALAEARAKAAALTAAQAQSQELLARVDEVATLEQELAALSEQLRDQVQQAAAAAQQQQAEHAKHKQELMAQMEQLKEELLQATSGQQQECEQAQQLKQQCDWLTNQLQQLQAEVQGHSDKAAGLQQELVAALQAKTDLQLQLEQANSTIMQLQVQRQQAEAALAALQQQQDTAVAENATSVEARHVLQEQVQQLQGQHEASTEHVQKLQAELTNVQAQLQAAEQKVHEEEAKLSTAESNSQQLQWKLAAVQTELQKVQRSSADTIKRLRQEADEARQQLTIAQEVADKKVTQAQDMAALEVGVFRQRWQEEFDKRRKLHNQVIELKGNIRVLARIRPMIEKERSAACSDGGGAEAAVRMVDTETVLLEAAATQREYEFDRVFGPGDGQLQVYDEVSGLVTSIMDGYNACILAYGQTGSGKTYTIEGPADDPGLNSRALSDLFKVSKEREAEISYTMSASVLEIYNEQIFDLLAGSKDTGDKLDIKEGPGGLFIPGLRIESVCGPEDVGAVLQKGKQNRSTFATNMNEHSSRSHLVLSIYVAAKHLTKDTSWSSKLHLIDLAGSERVSRSGAEGERLKEAAAINKSLSALGDVVAALQQRSSHVPYRNSKLTRLLEDSLGGSSKTLLVVNCSPASENVGETKCSLDFATRARKIELGAAVRVPEWSNGGSCNSPSRDGTVPNITSRPSQVLTGGGSGSGNTSSPGSAASSPRVGPRYSGTELRHTVTRRAAATSQREDK